MAIKTSFLIKLAIIGIVVAFSIAMVRFFVFANPQIVQIKQTEIPQNPIDIISEPPMPSVPSLKKSQQISVLSEETPVIVSSGNTVFCSGETEKQLKCYEKLYNAMVKSSGVKTAMEDLRSRYNDPFVKSECHQLAHIVGRAASHLYPTVSEALKNGDSFCWAGYYHGVMEGVAQEIKLENIKESINEICIDIPGKENYSFDYYNCVHGLGHGVMLVVENELFDALLICDYFSGQWEQSSCWSGAFMQNIILDELNKSSKNLKEDDPLYPCNAVGEKYKSVCYLIQTSRMLALTGNDFSKVFGLCKNIENAYVDICYQSLGRDASGKTQSNIEQTRTNCLLGEDYRQQSNCVIGAVKDFISYYHSNKEANQFCASLPEKLNSICTSTGENYYSLF